MLTVPVSRRFRIKRRIKRRPANPLERNLKCAHPETVQESNDIETVAPARVGDTLGYARVSTHEQNPDAQSDRLIEAGAIRVFTDIVSGKRFDRPALAELIDHARPGDRLCIIRLDRLGRSLRELLETVDGLKARGIHLISLEERLDTSSAAGLSPAGAAKQLGIGRATAYRIAKALR